MIKGAKVVVGDDSTISRKFVSNALVDLDIQVIEAATGNEVVRAINENKPALAILDISMPFPDGLTILRKIREDKDFKDMPVIICSVENGPIERGEAGILGVSGFLVKPINLNLLRQMVVDILEKARPMLDN